MPLIGYFGNVTGRTEEALQKREANSVKRGWGPEPGGNRSALMQSQGKGPPPAWQRRDGGADGGAASASAAAGQAAQSSGDTWWTQRQWQGNTKGDSWWSSSAW